MQPSRPSSIPMVSMLVGLSVLAALCTVGAPAVQAQKITVESADPPSGEQGTPNLNVRIKGKGFKSDSVASFLVTGTANPGGITVNNTQFVSSIELIANINIAEDAVIADFDIEVQSNGRTGKGIELFSVFKKGGAPAQDQQFSVSLGMRDDFQGDSVAGIPPDQLFSDCGLGFDSQGNHGCPYVSGQDSVGASFINRGAVDGRGFLQIFTDLTSKPGGRQIDLRFPEPTVCFAGDPACVPFADPFSGRLVFEARIHAKLVGLNSFDAIPVGASAPAAAAIFLDEVTRGVNWIIRFDPNYSLSDGFNCANATTVAVTRIAADRWQLTAAPLNLACLEEQRLKQGPNDFQRIHRGYLKLPFQLEFRRLP